MRKFVYELPDRKSGPGRPRRLDTDTKYREKLIELSGRYSIPELVIVLKASYGMIQRDLVTLKAMADEQAKGKKEA